MFLPSIVRAAFLTQLVLPALAVVHEHLAVVPSGWSKVKDAEASAPISLSVALSYQNLDQLESKVLSISTPGHPEYGKHLDINDVHDLFPPASDAPVLSWLAAAGVTNVHTTGHTVNFATTVGTASKLLNAHFAYYSDGSVQKLRTTQYSVPDHIASDIDLVFPTTSFGKAGASARTVITAKPQKPRMLTSRAVNGSCEKAITPACLKELYSVGDYQPDLSFGSRVGFGSFLGESALHSDLALYEKKFGIPDHSFSVELINGGVDDQNPITAQTGEANLDVQNIVGVGHPLPIVEYITGGSP